MAGIAAGPPCAHLIGAPWVARRSGWRACTRRLNIHHREKKSWHILNLMVGDVVVFRGDILHNGLGYPREHLRIHAYLYPPGYDHPSEVHFERASPTAPGAL